MHEDFGTSDIAKHLDPPWIDKLPADARIYNQGSNEDMLGFQHVADYLTAATKAHGDVHYGGKPMSQEQRRMLLENNRNVDSIRLHDAGLAIDPAKLLRMSVPDVVAKTAEWNKLLAK